MGAPPAFAVVTAAAAAAAGGSVARPSGRRPRGAAAAAWGGAPPAAAAAAPRWATGVCLWRPPRRRRLGGWAAAGGRGGDRVATGAAAVTMGVVAAPPPPPPSSLPPTVGGIDIPQLWAAATRAVREPAATRAAAASAVAAVASAAAAVVRFWAGLHIGPGDVVWAVLCMVRPRAILRAVHAAVRAVAHAADHRGRLFHPSIEYGASLWAGLEREVALFGAMNAARFGVRAAVAAAGLVGVSDPFGVSAVFSRAAHAAYAGWLLSRVKARVVDRSVDGRGPFGSAKARFLLNRVGDVAILAVAGGAVLDAVGIPLQSALTLGGFGGIALGLASREAAENVVGGLLLGVTAPFSPGDAIIARKAGSGTAAVEGVVRRVGLVNSSVVGFDGVPTTVPNSVFSAAAVTNLSRLRVRRFRQTIGLRYADAARVPAVVDGIRALLAATPGVDASKGITVHWVRYAPSSLDIEAVAFFSLGRLAFLDTVQQVLLGISRVVADAGAEFAFPTTTIEVAPGAGGVPSLQDGRAGGDGAARDTPASA